jgi:nucleoside-diphosphate-sugar epimerase
MAGSCAEYEWGSSYREGHSPLRPSSAYGVCKNALREIMEAYLPLAGITGAWGRIFFMLGPGEARGKLVSSIVRALLQGDRVECTEGSQIRDYLYVADVAAAFVALLDSNLQGPVNIGSGEGITIRDLALKIAHKLRRPDLITFGARSVDEPPFVVADVLRLSNELRWCPSFDLDRGIDETVSWYLKHAPDSRGDAS